jgi:acetyl-CoA carboxylase biotin carboxyl carrier protein
MALSDEDVRQILQIIDASALAEIKVETDGFSLYVRRGAAAGVSAESAAPSGSATPPAAAAPPAATAPPASGSAATDHAPAPAADDQLTIEAPMLGTFYRAEGPGQKPFVEVGSQVEPDTTVCIIEVMKMMNSVPSGVAGTVVEVLADNAQLVEYGQPLFRVQPT